MKCEDCIHEKVCEGYSNCEEAGLCEPKRPHGKWITTSNPNHSPFDNTNEFIYICSKCTYSSGDRITAYWNFCPNCGADMRKEGEKND